MKMSKLALSISKGRSTSLEGLSQRYFSQAGLVKRFGTGIYAQHNLLTKAQENIKNVIRSVLDKYDCVEVTLPMLQPKSIWEESGRWSSYIDSGKMFYCNMSNGSFVIAPTAEEAMLTFVKENLKSYKDLPVNFYQIGTKFRNELRSRGGMLRSKEFLMMDAYSFHSTEDSLKQEYERMKCAYFDIFTELGLQVIPVSALNGDMGGKKSEEFMVVSEIGEDVILVDERRKIAFNIELLEDTENLKKVKKIYQIEDFENLEKKKCIELGHIFQLGKKYSEKMNGMFANSDNVNSPYYMGCYGIGVSRTLATVCEQNCDENGLCWPENIAPYKAIIVCTKDKVDEAEKLYNQLLDDNIDIILDDRYDKSLGSKIRDWKILGIPYLIIIGRNFENDKYEIEKRSNGQKTIKTLSELKEIFC